MPVFQFQLHKLNMRLSLAGLGASVALWATISCAIHSVNRIDVFKRARKLMDAKILVGTTESVGDVQENELEKRTPLFLTEKSKRTYEDAPLTIWLPC